jgi:DNA-binding transcriptional ArsR family regulator
MAGELRARILIILDEHSRTGAPTYVADTELVEATGEPLQEIQRQLDILEAQGLIKPANVQQGRRSRISPAGSLAVESLIDATTGSAKARIGFNPSTD